MQTTAGVALADRTTLRLGGPARRLIETQTTAELVAAVAAADAAGEPVLILGGGSNLVVADHGFDGTVVAVASRGVRADVAPGFVRVQVAAGEDWDSFVAEALASGWAGVEALAGIPGTVGAAPIQNIGAYGQEVCDTIQAVHVWDRVRSQELHLPAGHCGFGYRTSRFKSDPHRFVVLDVTFWLPTGAPDAAVHYAELANTLGVGIGEDAPIGAVREAVLALRRRKGMVLDDTDPDTWSAGSFFTNPVLPRAQSAELPAGAPRWAQGEGKVKTSAAWLIEQAGFTRGYGGDRVSLSTKHPLALTNRGGGTTTELLDLAREVRDAVRDRFGIVLVNEPVLVGCSL